MVLSLADSGPCWGDPLLECKSYRMLAVSSVLYRLYANVVRQAMTEWCVQEGKVPEAQFGFYPGRDTMQPAFVLRHLVHAARQSRAAGERTCSRLFVAFMDFTQAYDRVDRAALWAHLQSIGMPQHMLRAVQGMYEGDTYVLVDGPKRTGPVSPTKGVKQGCPLSPLLFSLFINDFAASVPCLQARGVPLRHGGRVVSHVFYADDLALISYTEEGLQVMLRGLELYARRKGLTVNAAKSEVVVFNTRALSVRRHGGDRGCVNLTFASEPLKVVSEFKYLGLWLHNTLNMDNTHKPRARGMMAAMSEVMRLARNLGLRRSPWAMVRLFQTYCIPAGMYGCQLWGSHLMRMRDVFTSEVSKRHLRFLKLQLGVSYASPNWAVLAELGSKPFHYYWVRAICKFQHRILTSNSALLQDVARADAALAAEGGAGTRACWSGEVAEGLESIGQVAGQAQLGKAWSDHVKAGRVVELGAVMDGLERAYLAEAWAGFEQVADLRAYLHGGDGQEDRRTKTLTYFHWFKLVENTWPSYLKGLPSSRVHGMMKQLARFRLGSHGLEVETGRYNGVAWQDRQCTRCSADRLGVLTCKVGDEYHMVFNCSAFDDLRANIPGVQQLIDSSGGSLRAFMLGDVRVVMNFVSGCLDRLAAEGRGAEAMN